MNKPVNLAGATSWEPSPNNLEPFWMGFTPNRAFKKRPRMIARAKDMHYYDMTGRPTPATAAGPSSKPSRSRPPSLTLRRPSSSATPRCLNSPPGLPPWRRAT